MPFGNRIWKAISSRAGKAGSRMLRIRYGSCAVLLYHRVANLHTDPQLLAVSPENFDMHLAVLNSGFHLLTVAGFKEHLRTRKKFPAKSVLITFDDGYADNFQQALPILASHRAEALFYICTGNIGTDHEFWWDELERLLLCHEKFPSSFLIKINGKSYSSSDSILSRTKMYSELLPTLRNMDFIAREKIFSEIRALLPFSAPRESHRSVNELELKEMSKSPFVTIGAHTVNHCSLNALESDEQRAEIQKSIFTIEKLTGNVVKDFSFPFGTDKDFSKTTIGICKESGMEFVSANIPGCVHAKSDNYSLRRFLVRDWDAHDFHRQLNSFFNR
ncbi:MAG: polysaccharide deacetylase family protein [Bacteroidota bacterium]